LDDRPRLEAVDRCLDRVNERFGDFTLVRAAALAPLVPKSHGFLSHFLQRPLQSELMSFTLSSPAFPPNGAIPALYTCEGRDISPPLAWSNAPPGAKSFALIHDDPDAPHGRWVHWVLFNLPPSTRQLDDTYPSDPEQPDGARQGLTDFGRTGYGGPCPPSGTHRYLFTLYALDRMLAVRPGTSVQEVESAMKGHIVGQAQLMGTYRRKGR
jgi:Raf kinase inhibitor-like YbhB/YbcL family protein